MSGALVYDDYLNLIKNNNISNIKDPELQIQPSSVDLSLSDECYEINTSFLSPKTKVCDKLKKLSSKKINMSDGLVLKKNKNQIYIVKEQIVTAFERKVFNQLQIGGYSIGLTAKVKRSRCKTEQ